MKKLILLAIILLTFNVFAQEEVDRLKITPNGFNGYIVKSFPEMSSSSIFQNLKKWAEYNIKNTDYSNSSMIENEYLEYDIYYNEALRAEDGKNSPLWDVKMNVQVRIKDNRVRFDLEIISMPPSPSNPHSYQYNFTSSSFQYGFFNKKGEPRKRDAFARSEIENLANSIVNDIVSGISGKTDYKKSDW